MSNEAVGSSVFISRRKLRNYFKIIYKETSLGENLQYMKQKTLQWIDYPQKQGLSKYSGLS